MHHAIFFIVDLDELAKATGVIVMYCLCIAKRLQREKNNTLILHKMKKSWNK